MEAYLTAAYSFVKPSLNGTSSTESARSGRIERCKPLGMWPCTCGMGIVGYALDHVLDVLWPSG